MKRVQLFEFEDFRWLPSSLRQCMTLYIVVVHRLLRTTAHLTPILARALRAAGTHDILDLCSGATGALPDVAAKLRQEHHLPVEVTMTDLYPNAAAAASVAALQLPWLRYETRPVDARQVPKSLPGLRTMICSFHHMPPDTARAILKNAAATRQPLCIYEISDNGPPVALWWLAIPVGFVMTLLLTPLVRPLSFRQLLFTYLIPILPLLIAWDGAASNPRTYTVDDIRELLADCGGPGYRWQVERVKPERYPGALIYVLGLPT